VSIVEIIKDILFASKRFTNLELRVIDSVRLNLPEGVLPAWDRQISEINKIQRLPDGVEVNFYRMKRGRPTFESAIALPNKSEEHLLAKLVISAPSVTEKKLTANIWCVNGFLFSIEYDSSSNYFEELADANEENELKVQCEKVAL
jgi:hypothetical protein